MTINIKDSIQLEFGKEKPCLRIDNINPTNGDIGVFCLLV